VRICKHSRRTGSNQSSKSNATLPHHDQSKTKTFFRTQVISMRHRRSFELHAGSVVLQADLVIVGGRSCPGTTVLCARANSSGHPFATYCFESGLLTRRQITTGHSLQVERVGEPQTELQNTKRVKSRLSSTVSGARLHTTYGVSMPCAARSRPTPGLDKSAAFDPDRFYQGPGRNRRAGRLN